MNFRLSRRSILTLSVLAAVACGGSDGVSPSNEPPADIAPLSDLTRASLVGATIPGGLSVKVTDASGRPVKGANVAFAVTLGNGLTSPRLAETDANGVAKTTWTLGTIAGGNEVTAGVSGVEKVVKFSATGAAGAVNAISLSTRSTRLLVGVDTTRIVARAVDLFGNSTDAQPTFTVRDPTLIAIDNAGLVRALRRGASTWVVANASGMTDSTRVTVLDVGQSICTGAANPVELAIGQVITDVTAAGYCVHASTDAAEYAIIPFYNASVSSATTRLELLGQGLSPIPAVTAASLSSSLDFDQLSAPTPPFVPDYARESRMRAQERTESASRLAGARSWMRAQRNVVGGAAAASAIPAIGDLLKLNTTAIDFCDNPDYRTGRVVAITDRAIVVADTANPAGGFTSDEYRSFGVTFDTLVDPLDRKTFGDPSDIDNNGHVLIFFTRAVNELTTANASGVYLGYYYQRDLFPKTSTAGTCAGSNVAEILYLLVPDPNGTVNTNVRRKSDVLTFTLGTAAHEYQHLINASRRMYVNKFGAAFEEKWLDEGLSHIAEDLNFWTSSGKSPRQNLDVSLFNDPKVTAAYSTFMNFNRSRYVQYLGRTESQAPIGADAFDDDLYTRGAVWSFLRYAADRLGGGDAESQFWYKLVNDNATGLANLEMALGTPPGPWIRDWAISVYLDDLASGVNPRFTQPSFNMRSIVTNGGTGISYPLVTRTLNNNVSTSLTLAAYGVSFLRFSVAKGQEALLTATSGGLPLPQSVQLAVVRVR